MLFYRLDWLCNVILLLMAITTACAIYAYHVDSRRPDDDPKKKNYHPLAILLAPITFPLVIIFSVSIFILRVVTYGVFMILFIFALIFIHQSSVLTMIRNDANFIGNRLMDVNTFLIKILLRPWAGSRESA